jgi:hypothetical protein
MTSKYDIEGLVSLKFLRPWKNQTIKISFLKHSQVTLSLNILKNRLFGEKKFSTNYHKCILDWPLFFMYMYLRICRSLQKKLSSQIVNPLMTKKIGSSNCKSTCCHICGRSANLTNFESRQICKFSDLLSLVFLRTSPFDNKALLVSHSRVQVQSS